MPKFNAESIGGEIEYDFSTWHGPTGIVPEPSRAAVKRFMRNTQTAFKKMGLVDEEAADEATPDQIVDVMARVEDDDEAEEKFSQMVELVIDALAELCGNSYSTEEIRSEEGGMPILKKVWHSDGSPTHAVISALPFRPFMGFFGYLMGEVANPEISRPGTTNTGPRMIRSV